MKRLSTLTAIFVVVMIVSACGAEPAPTVDPAAIAGTAQAAAFTLIAQTQAAIPTNTLPPPTDTPTQTPAVTNTPLIFPTQELVALPSPTTAAASGDPCDTRVLSGDLKGKPTIIRIWNSTKTPITVSIYLNETEGHGECGYRSYNLAKNGDVVMHDVVYGCYNLWAWNTSGKPNFNSSGYGCVNNPDKWTFTVTEAVIKFTGP